MAQYRIHQESYIDDRHIMPNAEITIPAYGRKRQVRKGEDGKPMLKDGKPVYELVELHHKPGPHWEPLDDEAKAICASHDHVFTGFVPDAVEDLTKQLDDAQAKAALAAAAPAAAGIDPAMLASIVAQTVSAVLDAREASKGKGKAAA